MRCLVRCIAGIALIGVLFLGLLVGLLAYASHWLPSSDALEKADGIVVLAGDPRRALYAADLQRQGYAPRIWVSRPARDSRDVFLDRLGVHYPRQEDINTEVIEKAGVPREHVAYFGKSSISTFEEAQVLAALFAGQSPSLIVVTSPYHVRRARMILASALPGARLRVVATPYEEFPHQWWNSQDAARDLLLELAKIASYAAGQHFLSSAT